MRQCPTISASVCICSWALLCGSTGCSGPEQATARQEGLVYHDADGNGMRNGREKGLARVPVSNGLDVVLTDVRGRWMLPAGGPREPFVIAPRGWRRVSSTQPDTFALDRWETSATPTVHVGAGLEGVPGPDARVGFDPAMAPLPSAAGPGALPTAFNVGDLHVIVADDRGGVEDLRRFVEADLHHAGAARPVLYICSVGAGEVVRLLDGRDHVLLLDVGQVDDAVGLDAHGSLVRYGPLDAEGTS